VPPAAPSWTLQVTDVLMTVPETFALKLAVAPWSTIVAGGETATETGGTVMAAVALLLLSAWLVATM